MSEYKELWNQIHTKYINDNIFYDNWLLDFEDIIKNSKCEIIDLGCGWGNNTLFISERNKYVVACDYSDVALKRVENDIKSRYVRTINFDMTETFPFKDNYTDLIIADLCLHYFDKNTTINILNEISRVLKNNGYLIFRVNSKNDTSYGKGTLIEKDLYLFNGYKRRFFDQNDIKELFSDWDIIHINEEIMSRYEAKKVLWKCVVKNKK